MHVCVYTCSIVAVALNLYPIIASNPEVVPVCRILCVLPVDPAVVEILHRYRQETEQKGKWDTGKRGEIGMKKREGRKIRGWRERKEEMKGPCLISNL